MLTLLGVLLLITATVGAIASKVTDGGVFQNWNTKHTVLTGLAGGLVLTLGSIFFYAEPGTAYAVQYPWGTQKPVFNQGIHVKMFGRTLPFQFELPVKYIISRNEDGSITNESEYAYVMKAKKWEFNDAVKADIATSVVIGINTTDGEQFLDVADKNKTEKNLIYSRVLPNINAAIKNTCKIMSAQDYIAGEASDFDRFFRDQLENGMYILEEVNVNQPAEIIGDTGTVRTVTKQVSNNNQQKWYRIKRHKNGDPYRVKTSSLSSYGLTVIQAVVDEIDWEPEFDKRLSLQKNEVAQTQLEKQQAQREFYRTQKEIAHGEAEKAKEKARLEKEQIKETIAAETKAKVADHDLTREKKQYEVEVFKAKSKRVAADAQAYENQRLVNAGLTPQEKAEWAYKTKVDMMKALSGKDGITLPQTVFSSGDSKSSGGAGMLESILGAKILSGEIGGK